MSEKKYMRTRPVELHQCKVCGGWFEYGHFCIGRTKDTPPSDSEIIKDLEKALELANMKYKISYEKLKYIRDLLYKDTDKIFVFAEVEKSVIQLNEMG